MNKQEVFSKLKLASYHYYNNLDLIMTDKEYDSLLSLASLNGWIEEDVYLNDNSVIELNDVIYHDVPMLSLEKAKNTETLKSFYDKCVKAGAKTFRVEPKLDGMALSLKFKDGKLTHLVSRGDGEKGENLTYLINESNLTIKNLPLNINDNEVSEIRGELFCSKTQLKINNENKTDGNAYPNERVAVVGAVKKAKLGLNDKTEITFLAYSVYKQNKLLFTYENDLITFASSLLKEQTIKSFNELKETIERTKDLLKQLDVPTDGVVIKPNEEIDLGATSHHRKEFIAYKYPSTIKKSKIIDVTFSIGKTGSVTPRVEVEPTEIDGVVVKYLTGHNYDWVNKQNIRIGANAYITRSNDVIPAILSVDNYEDKTPINIPTICPYCQNKLKGDLVGLCCDNDECPSRLSFFMNYIVKVFELDGVSESLLNSLQMTSIKDLITISLDDLMSIKYNSNTSLGSKRANKIYNQLQNIKTNSEEYKWLLAFNFDRVGKETAKSILNHFGSLYNFLFSNNLEEDLSKIEGVGTITIQSITRKIKKAQEMYNELLSIGVVFSTNKKETVPLVGLFSHTGNVPSQFSNRKELTDYMETLGYKFSSSINKKTSFLLTEDKYSQSSKTKKAKELNIPILSWSEFITNNKG